MSPRLQPPPPRSERKGKTIEVPEPADRRPNLPDVYIPNVEDSYSNSASPRVVQTTEFEPQLNNEQLLQMLSTMRKQMGDQQIEMIQLCEAAAHENNTTTRIQTWLLRQIGIIWKSQSFPTTKENVCTPCYHCAPENSHTPLKARNMTGREPTTMMRIPGTKSTPEPQRIKSLFNCMYNSCG